MAEATIGHNSLVGANTDRLKSVIDRVETLINNRKMINDDISDIMKEAKGQGFDAKVIRGVLKFRAEDPEQRQSYEDLRDAYLSALGLI